MIEVTQSEGMFNLRIAVQNMDGYLLANPSTRLELVRAWKLEANNEHLYLLELSVSHQIRLSAVMIYNGPYGSLLFLDAPSIMIFVNDAILSNLEAFNAGHHWKFKGV